MDPISTRIALGAASGGAVVLPEIGEFIFGGYFAGAISHTADGNPTHLLILAPRDASGTGGTAYGRPVIQWNWQNLASPNRTYSLFDGFDDTVAVAAAGSSYAAANFANNATINGYSDWYLPSRFEFNIIFYNLKPHGEVNVTNQGANPYSVPRRDSNFTLNDPPQTSVAIFREGGAQAIAAAGGAAGSQESRHWLSEGFPNQAGAWFFQTRGAFPDSGAGGVSNTSSNRVEPCLRLIRKEPL